MNRVDRLFTMLLVWQQKWTTAQAPADTFEIGQRTVYRDIAARSEMGVPTRDTRREVVDENSRLEPIRI